MSIQIGQMAPDFTLFNTEKKEVSLSSLRGKKVVILFFPAAFTGVCTAELCNMRDNIAYYNQTNAVVLGISVDMPFSLAIFRDQQKLSFDLLSDFNKTTIAAYDVIHADFAMGMKNVAKRAAFVVDEEGKIVYAEVCPNLGDQPNFEAIQNAVK